MLYQKVHARLDPSLDQELKEFMMDCQKLKEYADTCNQQIDLLRHNIQQKQQFGFLFSKNEHMLKTFGLAEKYKDLDSPILITGEKGCAKEALARLIHLNSFRKGPFVMTDEHFSMASFFEQKEATLYFPHVSLLSPASQKLLESCLHHAWQHHNRLIVSVLHPGHLEPSLHHKMNPLVLSVLPLRERKEDILHLMDIFIRELSQNKKTLDHFSTAALKKILEYPWPGNIGELKSVVKQILRLNPNEKSYSLSHLPENIVGSSLKNFASIIESSQTLPQAEAILEEALVRESLVKHNWNKTQVSKDLGISRSGLLQKVQKYHIK
ncbi:MAG: sigma-54-dependent Fis family transcriptional regulator [Deltaproteobacteria bacterium]|nr:sigma-54-dependent Fis family transcriptional regulator [Deltaproteobacteria bacterium]